MTGSVLDRVRRLLPPGLRRGGGLPPRPPSPADPTSAGTPRRRQGPAPKRGAGVLGIEIARGGLRFVELGQAGNRAAYRSHGVVAYGETEELGGVLQMIVEEYDILAKDVHLVDSTCRANLRVHRMPDIPDPDMNQIVMGEISSEADLLGEPLVGDWCRLGEVGGEAEILVGKAPLADRVSVRAACESAGLRLQVMTSSSVALAHHLLAAGEVPEGETVGILDIGRSKTNMALLTDGHVRLVREVYQGVSGAFLKGEGDPGGEIDLDAIGAGLDEIVGTVQQIQRTWEQYKVQTPGSALHHILMTGETTQIRRLIGLLQHDLRVPVRTWDPTIGLDISNLPEGFERTASAFALPWVLATTPSRLVELNFAEGVPDLRPIRILQGTAGLILAGIVAVGSIQVALGIRLENREEEFVGVEARVAELENDLGLLREGRDRWNGWLEGQVAAGGLPAPDLQPHLVELTRHLPTDLRLRRIEFVQKGEVWRLETNAVVTRPDARASHVLMERFVRDITNSPLITDVSMRPLSYEKGRRAGRDEQFEFTVVARILAAVDPGKGAS